MTAGATFENLKALGELAGAEGAPDALWGPDGALAVYNLGKRYGARAVVQDVLVGQVAEPPGMVVVTPAGGIVSFRACPTCLACHGPRRAA